MITIKNFIILKNKVHIFYSKYKINRLRNKQKQLINIMIDKCNNKHDIIDIIDEFEETIIEDFYSKKLNRQSQVDNLYEDIYSLKEKIIQSELYDIDIENKLKDLFWYMDWYTDSE